MDKQPSHRPPFIRAQISLLDDFGERIIGDAEQASTNSLADLILHNALANPDHIFAVQTFQDSTGILIQSTPVSFLKLAYAVEHAAIGS